MAPEICHLFYFNPVTGRRSDRSCCEGIAKEDQEPCADFPVEDALFNGANICPGCGRPVCQKCIDA
jgi:hypothetical protein